MTVQATIVSHANRVAERWRKRGAKTDRVNRYLGRVDAIRTRIAARAGEPLPVLYVREGEGYHAELTTWAGQVVGKVEIRGTARGFHGVKLYCYRAVIEGRSYHGRGQGPGMYLNLRPGKVVG
jgi:hypothetical protein